MCTHVLNCPIISRCSVKVLDRSRAAYGRACAPLRACTRIRACGHAHAGRGRVHALHTGRGEGPGTGSRRGRRFCPRSPPAPDQAVNRDLSPGGASVFSRRALVHPGYDRHPVAPGKAAPEKGTPANFDLGTVSTLVFARQGTIFAWQDTVFDKVLPGKDSVSCAPTVRDIV